MSIIQDTLTKSIEDLEKALKSLNELSERLNIPDGLDRQVVLLNLIDEAVRNNRSSLLGGFSGVELETSSIFSLTNVALEFLLSVYRAGSGKYLKGYTERLSLDTENKLVGVDDFNNPDEYEYSFKLDSIEEHEESILIYLNFGVIDITNKEFYLNDETVDILIKNKELRDKQEKLITNSIRSLSLGLSKLGFNVDLGLLTMGEDNHSLYGLVAYSDLDIKRFVESLMLSFYGTHDEGVVYVEDSLFVKSVGSNNLLVGMELDDNDNYLTTWGLSDNSKESLYDIFKRYPNLYDMYSGETNDI